MEINAIALFVTIPVVVLTLGFVFFLRSSTLSKKHPDGVLSGEIKDNPRRVGYWVLTLLLAGVFVFAGISKLLGADSITHQFSEWGYSEGFQTFVGVSQVVGAILLILPRSAAYAASYLGVIMAGAAYTHLAFDGPWMALIPLACLAGLGLIVHEDLRRRGMLSRAGKLKGFAR